MRLCSALATACLSLSCGGEPEPAAPSRPRPIDAVMHEQAVISAAPPPLPPVAAPPNSPASAPDMVQIEAPAPAVAPVLFADAPKCSPDIRELKGFPDGVDGIRFGATMSEVRATCTRMGLTVGDASLPGQPSLFCDGTPVRQSFRIDFVRVSFCGGKACGIDLIADHMLAAGDDELRRLILAMRGALDSKYGPPSCGAGYSKPGCSADLGNCLSRRDGYADYYWMFESPSKNWGSIRLASGARRDGSPRLEIRYSTPTRVEQESKASKVQGI